jgi:hypothetical protein
LGHVSLAVSPSWWFLLFAWTWVLPSCTILSKKQKNKTIWVLCFIDAWQAFIIMLDQSFFLTDLFELVFLTKECEKMWSFFYPKFD